MISKNSSKKSTFSSKITTADQTESTALSGSRVSFHPSLVISEIDTAISLVLAAMPQTSSGNGMYGFVVVVVSPSPLVVVGVVVEVARGVAVVEITGSSSKIAFSIAQQVIFSG